MGVDAKYKVSNIVVNVLSQTDSNQGRHEKPDAPKCRS